MVKKSGYKKVIELKPTSWAMFQGTFGAIIGLGVSILYSINATVDFAQDTDRLLAGLAFGIGAGIVSVLVVPLLYFGIGWIIGLVQGWIFNTVLGASGGLVVNIVDEE